MSVRISAIFDGPDQADLAVRRLSEKGITVHSRRTTRISDSYSDEGLAASPLPGIFGNTLYGGGIASSMPGQTMFGSILYTGLGMGPAGGEGGSDELQLEVDVDEDRAEEALAVLTNTHGENVQQF